MEQQIMFLFPRGPKRWSGTINAQGPYKDEVEQLIMFLFPRGPKRWSGTINVLIADLFCFSVLKNTESIYFVFSSVFYYLSHKTFSWCLYPTVITLNQRIGASQACPDCCSWFLAPLSPLKSCWNTCSLSYCSLACSWWPLWAAYMI